MTPHIDVMIDDCEDASAKLSVLENAFVDQLVRQMSNGKPATFTQEEILTKIWHRL